MTTRRRGATYIVLGGVSPAFLPKRGAENEMRKVNLPSAAAPQETRPEETRAPILKARPIQNPRPYKKMLTHDKRRYA